LIINDETETSLDAIEFEREFGDGEGLHSTSTNKLRSRLGTLGRVTVFVIALFATLIPISVGEVHVSDSATHIDRYLMLHGYYAMDAQELLEIVRLKKIEAYWTGPVVGAKYVLDTSEVNRVTIRYLLEGDSVDDIDSGKRVVSTYHVNDGYSVITNAANFKGTTGLSTVNGNRILFYENYPKNIYLGIKGKDVEIEIYDKEPGRALQLAITEGLVRPV
jgi:hypothetical protein